MTVSDDVRMTFWMTLWMLDDVLDDIGKTSLDGAG